MINHLWLNFQHIFVGYKNILSRSKCTIHQYYTYSIENLSIHMQFLSSHSSAIVNLSIHCEDSLLFQRQDFSWSVLITVYSCACVLSNMTNVTITLVLLRLSSLSPTTPHLDALLASSITAASSQEGWDCGRKKGKWVENDFTYRLQGQQAPVRQRQF